MNAGRGMWECISKRYEGRENATTKFYTQRTLRQKLENATCRGGADVETHLSYLLALRERLAALDADLGDDWMVDIMLKMLVLLGGSQLTTPMEARAMILTLEKNSALECSQKRPTEGGISSRGEQASASSSSSGIGGKKRSQPDSTTDQLQQVSKNAEDS
ncbi:hypothetical protein PHMEG_0007313 [Phytophthora megakarya]|uniref:Uncharacterized protein n=1 Tax=Phytophthora megakarya TaxID=4795 RepID=A0A225WN49_9STRA|nr:hypothetical protein PHMEG_0007313 [Phytophthora megakarya]